MLGLASGGASLTSSLQNSNHLMGVGSGLKNYEFTPTTLLSDNSDTNNIQLDCLNSEFLVLNTLIRYHMYRI